MRQVAEEIRRGERDHAEADRDRDHEQVVAIVLEIDGGQDSRAGRRDHAEHHKAGAAEHHERDSLDKGGPLRQQAEQKHDDAAGYGYPARAHAGDADKADILRERRIGKGVEQTAEQRADAIGAQPARQRIAVDGFAGDLAQRQKHSERFDHHHDHDDAHGDDRHQMELRHSEMERKHDVTPWRRYDLLEMHDAEQAGQDRAGNDAEQYRDVGDEAASPFDQAKDDQQHEKRDAQSLQLSVTRIRKRPGHAIDHFGQGGQSATGPVDTHAHQRDADDHDDCAGHDRWK
ncbi:hypothetical protein GALL_504750 [mine drainage metagenome]|uniref:Uncharacterized protein n=1 Tax=mine drainage metagenome TaxID=410659 RepID=A0A1J5PJH6_9ZZZZ